MSQNCVQLFCGCQFYLGGQLDGDPDIKTKVYLSIGWMLLVLTISVRIGSQWFIFKDYYPMKQRSPVLCILMILCVAVQLIMYPLAYTYNYFTRNWGDFKYIYRATFHAFDGSLYLLYFIRSLRLAYAHEIDNSRRNTWIFKFMKHEYALVGFFLTVTLLKIIPILAYTYSDEDMFLTYIDINSYIYDGPSNAREISFGIKEIIHEFVWLCAIIYCIWLQTLVHPKYSMRNQLLTVFGVGFLFNVASICIYISKIMIGEQSIVRSICLDLPQYPILQMMRDLNVLGLFVISVIYPLFKKRVYHMLLPTGRHHDIVKTMRDFLMESQFIDIFQAFLLKKDEDEGRSKNSTILEYWKKLMIVKYRVTNKELRDRQQCLEQIKTIIREIEDQPVRQIHSNLLNTLKQSIISLESCEEGEQIDDKERYLEEINEKIEELQLIFLEKLDHIYKSEFRQTKSYYFLKMYTIRNKKININMITLGMAVMVESEDAL